MVKPVIFDPTINDMRSKVRGVGRYLQILKETFENEFVFSNTFSSVSNRSSSIFINPFFNFLQHPLTMRRVAKKQVAVIHDLIPLKYPDNFPVGIKGKLNILLNKLALKNYDVIITDSEASKKDIIKILGMSPDRIRVVYPTLPNVFSNANVEGSLRTENYCLYVGDATWNKNLVNLARAIKIINVTCLFAGNVFGDRTLKVNNPWQKEFNEFLKESDGDKRFVFMGFVDDYKLVNLYEQSRCNILVSRDEGFGFSFLESAQTNTPSVLSNIQVFKEIAQDSALFCDFNDPHDIANAVGELYFNDEIRRKIGFKAQERSTYFSRKRFKEDFLRALRS